MTRAKEQATSSTALTLWMLFLLYLCAASFMRAQIEQDKTLAQAAPASSGYELDGISFRSEHDLSVFLSHQELAEFAPLVGKGPRFLALLFFFASWTALGAVAGLLRKVVRRARVRIEEAVGLAPYAFLLGLAIYSVLCILIGIVGNPARMPPKAVVPFAMLSGLFYEDVYMRLSALLQRAAQVLGPRGD